MGTKGNVNINWQGEMAFEAELNGHKFMIDAGEKVGGKDKGPRPKPLMLAALAGCTGMDVVSILKKMRVELDDFSIDVEGEQNDEHPVQYVKMHINYTFKGKNLDKAKIEKAVNLSQERYCGVSDFYKKVIPITHEINIEES
ncbi:MAG: OsmC family protein [Salinivirgaceae bacterium]|jgi:putative redox protein|nr:OsmC family protein [Salinivirgaceae bacterium]